MPSSARLDVSPPPLMLLGAEPWRAAMEFMAFKLDEFKPRKAVPPGDGHPVIIFPGMATDGSAVTCLRDYCESLGYTVIDWGRGFNIGPTGDLDRWLADLALHTADLLQGRKGTASLIGWSLGGLYAREIGKLLAPQVRQVITIGTPFNAEAEATSIGWLCRLLGAPPAVFSPGVTPVLSRRLRKPPALPTTSIYSRSDGVVAWETCCHASAAKQVQDIEVEGSHLGMGWNPAVLQIVGDRLGQRPGHWQRYVHPA